MESRPTPDPGNPRKVTTFIVTDEEVRLCFWALHTLRALEKAKHPDSEDPLIPAMINRFSAVLYVK